MSNFAPFAQAVHARLTELSKQEMFTTVTGDELWDTYLKSFPLGTDPIFKVATTHTCTCCKQFIRGMGTVVAIIDGKLTSIWGIRGLETPYKEVASAMHALVISHPITDLYRPTEPAYGAESTKKLLENGDVHRFNHFWGNVNKRHLSPTPDKAKGDYRTTVQVFQRGLDELSSSAIAQVLELIESNALYRGAEHRQAVHVFKTMKEAYLSMPQEERNAFLWQTATQPVARFRNTVIGTLVQDLSEGVELDRAVASFEQKVAPTNYKRTTALITQSMVDSALKTLKGLGLEDAVSRRFAKLSDVGVTNVLWVGSDTATKMKGSLADILTQSIAPPKASPASEISITDFMLNVAPTAKEVSVLFTSKHVPNLVSITAPQYKDSGQLFKWSNDFGWSYNGNITDSITEKVKKAGGNTNAKVRVSLEWFNYDDLDLHAVTPSRNHIYFGSKQGILDVDMNAGGRDSREPVENLSWDNLQDGPYRISVNQYSQRETVDVGFNLQFVYGGNNLQWSYSKPVKGSIDVLAFTVKNGEVVSFATHPDFGDAATHSTAVWGISTNNMVKVQTIMLSPNYWDDNSVGNKHWFFLLDGCRNPDPTRGMYNEFLTSKLEESRRVFEVLGSKLMCQPTDDQLSGLGFSSTKQDTVVVEVVTATSKRQYSVKF